MLLYSAPHRALCLLKLLNLPLLFNHFATLSSRSTAVEHHRSEIWPLIKRDGPDLTGGNTTCIAQVRFPRCMCSLTDIPCGPPVYMTAF